MRPTLQDLLNTPAGQKLSADHEKARTAQRLEKQRALVAVKAKATEELAKLDAESEALKVKARAAYNEWCERTRAYDEKVMLRGSRGRQYDHQVNLLEHELLELRSPTVEAFLDELDAWRTGLQLAAAQGHRDEARELSEALVPARERAIGLDLDESKDIVAAVAALRNALPLERLAKRVGLVGPGSERER